MARSIELGGIVFALAVVLAGCSASRPAAATEPNLSFVDASLARADAGRERTDSERVPATTATCSDELGAVLARVSCDGERILTKYPASFEPQRLPGEPTRNVLAAVADLLTTHDEILLVRIEVGSSREVSKDALARRNELDATQARANAVLEYLWHRHGISPERLEAVGRGGGASDRSTRWSVVFRIAQHARH